MLDRLLPDVVEPPGEIVRFGDGGLPAIGVEDDAAVGAADQLLVAAGVVGDPDRRAWLGGRLRLDGDVLEAVLLALVA